MPHFGTASTERLLTLDSRLQLILFDAIEIFDFTVVCGYRSPAAQDDLYAQGRTTPGPIVTYKRGGESIHNELPSLAVDVAPYYDGAIQWTDIKAFEKLARLLKAIAFVYDVELEWGGDWESFKDRPHFQIKP